MSLNLNKAYAIFFSKNKPNSASELLSEPSVFYNENMKIGNKVIGSVWVFGHVAYCIAAYCIAAYCIAAYCIVPGKQLFQTCAIK